MKPQKPPRPDKATRQKEHKARMKEAGFERLEVWVHHDDRGELKRFAQFLQSRHIAPVLKSGA